MGKSNLGLIADHRATGLTVATHYIELPTAEGVCGLGLRWFDATASATITLESTNDPRVASDSTTAGEWGTESNTIVGPTAAGAGGSSTNLGNIGMARLRLKVVAAAVTTLQVRVNWRSQ